MKALKSPVFVLATFLMTSGLVADPVFGQTATAPYVLTVFAKAPSWLSAPDSVVVHSATMSLWAMGTATRPTVRTDSAAKWWTTLTMDGTAVHSYTVSGPALRTGTRRGASLVQAICDGT